MPALERTADQEGREIVIFINIAAKRERSTHEQTGSVCFLIHSARNDLLQ